MHASKHRQRELRRARWWTVVSTLALTCLVAVPRTDAQQLRYDDEGGLASTNGNKVISHSDGSLYFVYADQGSIYLAQADKGVVVGLPLLVSDNLLDCGSPSMALASDGATIGVLFTVGSGADDPALYYVHGAAGGLLSQPTYIHAGNSPALAASGMTMHLAWREYEYDIRHHSFPAAAPLAYVGSPWSFRSVLGQSVSPPAIAAQPGGGAAIAFQHSRSDHVDLNLATVPGQAWNTATLLEQRSGSGILANVSISLASDPFDRLFVAWSDRNTNPDIAFPRVMVMHRDGFGSWRPPHRLASVRAHVHVTARAPSFDRPNFKVAWSATDDLGGTATYDDVVVQEGLWNDDLITPFMATVRTGRHGREPQAIFHDSERCIHALVDRENPATGNHSLRVLWNLSRSCTGHWSFGDSDPGGTASAAATF